MTEEPNKNEGLELLQEIKKEARELLSIVRGLEKSRLLFLGSEAKMGIAGIGSRRGLTKAIKELQSKVDDKKAEEALVKPGTAAETKPDDKIEHPYQELLENIRKLDGEIRKIYSKLNNYENIMGKELHITEIEGKIKRIIETYETSENLIKTLEKHFEHFSNENIEQTLPIEKELEDLSGQIVQDLEDITKYFDDMSNVIDALVILFERYRGIRTNIRNSATYLGEIIEGIQKFREKYKFKDEAIENLFNRIEESLNSIEQGEKLEVQAVQQEKDDIDELKKLMKELKKLLKKIKTELSEGIKDSNTLKDVHLNLHKHFAKLHESGQDEGLIESMKKIIPELSDKYRNAIKYSDDMEVKLEHMVPLLTEAHRVYYQLADDITQMYKEVQYVARNLASISEHIYTTPIIVQQQQAQQQQAANNS